MLFFVPGVAGDGGGYDGLINGLRAGGVAERLEILSWGAPGPLFVMNFQNEGIHRGAEAKLSEALKRWRQDHPTGRIKLLSHSAGGGVILGALSLPDTPPVQTAVLLNPSVSPGYDLSAPLRNIQGQLHVFHSDEDKLFLSYRTSTFGTYDNVKTKAAGNVGFTLDPLPPEMRAQVVQHPREAWWTEQSNDGSHFGTLAEPFARQTIAPLLK